MIYRVHAESLISREDYSVLYPHDWNYYDRVVPLTHLPPYQRLYNGMFELHFPEPTAIPHIVIVEDDDGPFAVCGTFTNRNIWKGCTIEEDIKLSKYRGYTKNIDPMIVRPSLFRFPKMGSSCINDKMFWGLNRPNPFDLHGNFLHYLMSLYHINYGNSDSLKKKLNKLYGLLLENADPECLRIARRWPQPCRGAVMTACVENSIRVRQLFGSFPLLAWLLYVRTDIFPSPISTSRGEQTVGSFLRRSVEDGLSLERLAKTANVPMHMRKLDPHVLCKTDILDANEIFFTGTAFAVPALDITLAHNVHCRRLGHRNENSFFGSCQKMMDCLPPPKDTRRRNIWCAAYDNRIRDVNKIKWLYREMKRTDRRYLSKLKLQLKDWMVNCRGKNRWRPELSWRQACRLSGIWHKDILERERRNREELDKIPFPDPWFGTWELDDWRIEHIPNRPSLSAHGLIQRNCVSTYSNRIASESMQIYRALLNGKDKLTIAVHLVSPGVFTLGQVAGTANTTPEPEIKEMVDNWFKEMTTEETVTVEVKEFEEVEA